MKARRVRGLLAPVVVASLVWLVSAPAAAQSRPQPKIAVPKFDTRAIPCEHLVQVRHKQNLTALPANLIEPKRTPEGWPDLQGSWTNVDYIGGNGHSVEVGFDPAGFPLECFDPPSNVGSIMVDPLKGQIPYNSKEQKRRDQLVAALYAPTKRIERWTMIDQDRMYHEMIIDDPKIFSKPWKMATTLDRQQASGTTQETACHEGERDIDHITVQGLRATLVGWHGYHIHVDLETGKALGAFEQHYLDESGQPLGHSFAPATTDEQVAAAVAAKKAKTAAGSAQKPTGAATTPAKTPTAK